MSQVRSERSAARAAPRRATAATAATAVAVPALRLVDDSARPRRRALTRAVTVLASALAAAGLFGVVCLHVLLTQGQAELDALHARADAAEKANAKLTVEVAQLEAPARVAGWARVHLGMVPLASVSYLPAVDPAAPLPPVPEEALPAPVATGSTDGSAAETATVAAATSAEAAAGDEAATPDAGTASGAAAAASPSAPVIPTP